DPERFRPAALAVGSVHNTAVAVCRERDHLLAELGIAGASDLLAADRSAIAEGVHALRDVAHRHLPEANRPRRLLLSGRRINVYPPVAGVAGDVGITAVGEVLDPVFDAGRAHYVKVVSALGHVHVFEEEAEDAHEVVAVVVGEEDDLDFGQRYL